MDSFDDIQIALQAASTVPTSTHGDLAGLASLFSDSSGSPDMFLAGFPIWIQTLDDDAPVLRSGGRCILVADRRIAVLDGAEKVAIAAPIAFLSAIAADSLSVSFTPAEELLCAQLVCGLTLRQIAEIDGLAYETKRTQLKGIFNKTDFGNQQNLTMFFAAEIGKSLNIHALKTKGEDNLLAYVSRFLPPTIRTGTIMADRETKVRYIEYGPKAGRPIIVCHPMIFPMLGREDVDLAHEMNCRFIWPIRNGMLDENAISNTWSDHIGLAVKGVSACFDHFCDEPVTIVALVSSGAVAAEYARKNPQRVEHIVFGATCYSAGRYRRNFRYFGENIAELMIRAPKIGDLTLRYIRNKTDNKVVFRKLIEKVFAKSPLDLDLLQHEFCDPFNGQRLMDAILNSFESVRQDYSSQFHFDWRSVASLPVPMTILHGAEDGLHSVAEIEAMARKAGGLEITILPQTGHLTQGPHLHHILTASVAVKQAIGPQNLRAV